MCIKTKSISGYSLQTNLNLKYLQNQSIKTLSADLQTEVSMFAKPDSLLVKMYTCLTLTLLILLLIRFSILKPLYLHRLYIMNLYYLAEDKYLLSILNYRCYEISVIIFIRLL